MTQNLNDGLEPIEHLPEEPTTERIRPWGTVTVLEEGSRYRINRIEVNPGHHISTQMHYHRSEHWIVVAGTAKVICDGQETVLMQKQSTYVPMCTPHRVENPGVIPLVMIEVQNGEYLGEDDIIRFPGDAEF
jgi:mannose-6-phosphate isomerase-like protein (cupin superfamily)